MVYCNINDSIYYVLTAVVLQGTKYSIWRLSDLVNCDKTVSFFLFNTVNRDLWKTLVGSVVGILNASLMQNAEKVICMYIVHTWRVWFCW